MFDVGEMNVNFVIFDELVEVSVEVVNVNVIVCLESRVLWFYFEQFRIVIIIVSSDDFRVNSVEEVIDNDVVEVGVV